MRQRLAALPTHLQGVLIVTAGMIFLSFDSLLIRLTHTDGWNVVFWRGLLMAISLMTWFVIKERGAAWEKLKGCFNLTGTLAALILGISTASFVLSVSLTSVANTLVILTSAPLFAALFSFIFLGERIQLSTLLTILAAAAGVILVFFGSTGSERHWGDWLALLTAALTGAHLTLFRHNNSLPRTPLVALCGIVAAIIAIPFSEPFSLALPSYLTLSVMGLVQMPIALILMTTGTRYLPAPEVSLLLLVETLLGPIWVWIAFGERVPEQTWLGGAILLGALFLHSWYNLRRVKRQTQ